MKRNIIYALYICFQYISRLMRRNLKQLQVSSINRILKLLALPLKSGDQYIQKATTELFTTLQIVQRTIRTKFYRFWRKDFLKLSRLSLEEWWTYIIFTQYKYCIFLYCIWVLFLQVGPISETKYLEQLRFPSISKILKLPTLPHKTDGKEKNHATTEPFKIIRTV